jgi:hypothetical protein
MGNYLYSESSPTYDYDSDDDDDSRSLSPSSPPSSPLIFNSRPSSPMSPLFNVKPSTPTFDDTIRKLNITEMDFDSDDRDDIANRDNEYTLDLDSDDTDFEKEYQEIQKTFKNILDLPSPVKESVAIYDMNMDNIPPEAFHGVEPIDFDDRFNDK